MYTRLSRGKDNEDACKAILDAYETAGGSTARAALSLGVHKTTLLRAVRRLGLSAQIAERWPSRVREAFVP